MRERRKVAAVVNDFLSEVDGLLRLDALNQKRYRTGRGRPNASQLTKGQMCLITEGIFTRAFSSYELFLEDAFILYVRGRPTQSGRIVESYLRPRNTTHAREMIKSQMTFLEWNSPDNVIERADTYLGDNNPVKLAISTNRARLSIMRKVRNAIAHRSTQARTQFASVVTQELMAPPLMMPSPGEFLLMTDPRSRTSYFLVEYMSVLKSVAVIVAG